MKINTLNKTLLAAFIAVTLAACTNTSTPESSAAANTNTNTEIVAESSDIIDESIREDSKDSKPAYEEMPVEKPKDSSSNKKEEAKDNNTTINVEKKSETKISSDANKKEESNESQSNLEAQPQESNAQKVNSQENINYQERDGVYISNLIASKNGERDSQMGLTSLANLRVDGETLILEGTIDYLKNPDSYNNAEEYDKSGYNFKLTNDTKYQAVGGMADPEIFTKDEFVNYYNEVKDSGLALKIEVKDGVVTTVSVAS